MSALQDPPRSLASSERCRYCFEHPDRRCPVCARRQRQAWRLHEHGLDSGEIAASDEDLRTARRGAARE